MYTTQHTIESLVDHKIAILCVCVFVCVLVQYCVSTQLLQSSVWGGGGGGVCYTWSREITSMGGARTLKNSFTLLWSLFPLVTNSEWACSMVARLLCCWGLGGGFRSCCWIRHHKQQCLPTNELYPIVLLKIILYLKLPICHKPCTANHSHQTWIIWWICSYVLM